MNRKELLRSLIQKRRNDIPVFFSLDNGYVKYFLVCLNSLIAHSNAKHNYLIHVLHTDISEENQAIIKKLERSNITISFHDVTDSLKTMQKKMALRDYYSLSTYYRVFIPDMFPEYDTVLYLDSDTILMQDVAEFFRYRLGEYYVGAVSDVLIRTNPMFGDYAEKVLGISRVSYFNAGVLLINSELFRKQHMINKFKTLLKMYSFVVAQDQDYLNILCKDHVLWLDATYNVQMAESEERPLESLHLVHYNFAEKPWHNKDVKYAEQFWKHAVGTHYEELLVQEYEDYPEEKKIRDRQAGQSLLDLAISEIHKEDNYYNLYVEPKHLTRAEILEKIESLEKSGIFDQDAENDPPGRELMPNEVDYMRKSWNAKMRSRYAFRVATMFVNNLIKQKQLVIKEVRGMEHLANLSSGAIITCNHFNPFDSFAMQLLYNRSGQRKNHRGFYRVINETNYTSFPGFYGLLMRNCNTLPLSSNPATMMKFMLATNTLLQQGNFILIYPEQSLWWNYRKPKPLKSGGFTLAVKANVPVLPVFITMEDTDTMDGDGYPVQAYTIHVAEPIYPDKSKSRPENVKEMLLKNYNVWKQIYEDFYGIPLTYTCGEVNPDGTFKSSGE